MNKNIFQSSIDWNASKIKLQQQLDIIAKT